MTFPLDESELKKTEDEIGSVLPISYRNSMMLHNGGAIEINGVHWELFPIRDETSKESLSRTSSHIVRETQAARNWPRFPENACAIAGNGAGDLLLIFKKGPIFEPKIFYWNHEDGGLESVVDDFVELDML